MNEVPAQPRRSWLKHATGAFVSIGCLVWILGHLDFDQILHAFATADYRTLPVMIVVVSTILLLNAWRWTWMLRPLGRFSIREAFPPLMIGLAMNNILPARLGELVRVDLFCRRNHTPRAAVLAGIALERVFDIVSVLGFLMIGLACLPQTDPRIRDAAWWLVGLTSVAVAGAGIYVLWTETITRWLNTLLQRVPGMPAGIRQWVNRFLCQSATGLGVLRSRTLAGRSFVNTLAQWGLAAFQMSLALYAFGISISPAVACLLVSVVAIGVTVPSAPGFIGVIQALFVLVINKQTVGPVDEAAVVAASVYYHMTQYLLVTATGLILLLRSSWNRSSATADLRESRHSRTDSQDVTAPGSGRIAA
ncbi:MAG: lysylphosphatidylglycerol synthase transmembrane domain-containing protein [Planctomycetaceae bacterium]